MRLGAGFIALVLVALALGWPAHAAEPKPPAITSLGKGPLAVKGKKDSDRAAANLSVLNADEKPGPLRLTFQAASSDKVRLAGYKPRIVEPGATRVTVTFAGFKKLKSEPVEGQLVAEGRERPVARAVSITPALQPSRDWASCILWAAVVAAGALALVGVLVGNRELVNRAAGPKWSFESWATTLTAAGGLLGTVLGAATLPEIPREIDKDTLIRLNLLFGLLVVVGPFVFEAIRNPTVRPNSPDAGYTGWNLTLLLACAITAGAVLGELATLALLGWELAGPGSWGKAAVWAVGVVALLAAYYLVVTTVHLVRTDWKGDAERELEKATKAAAEPQLFRVIVGGTRGEEPGEPLPEHRLEVSIQRRKAISPRPAPDRAAADAAPAPVAAAEVEALPTPRRWSLP